MARHRSDPGASRPFLVDAAAWCADAIAMGTIRAEPLHRRKLATDVTEIGMIALHLPFDDPAAPPPAARSGRCNMN
jgi:hypothetical protein